MCSLFFLYVQESTPQISSVSVTILCVCASEMLKHTPTSPSPNKKTRDPDGVTNTQWKQAGVVAEKAGAVAEKAGEVAENVKSAVGDMGGAAKEEAAKAAAEAAAAAEAEKPKKKGWRKYIIFGPRREG